MKTNQLVKTIEKLGLEASFNHVRVGEEERKLLLAYYDGEEATGVHLDWIGEWFINNPVFAKLSPYTRSRLLNAFIEYAHTPFDEREEEKRYIFPLPGLITTDGEQQYLTQVGRHWFACRRKMDLRQTWKEEHIKWVPEEYRHLKVEYSEDGDV